MFDNKNIKQEIDDVYNKNIDLLEKEEDKITFRVVKDVLEFYVQYCEKESISPIEDLVKNNIAISVVKTDEKYRKAMVCIVFVDFIKKSPAGFESAFVFNVLYSQFKQSGCTHYDAIKNALSLFDVTYDENMSAILTMTDSDILQEQEFDVPESE